MPRILEGWEQAKLVETDLRCRSGSTLPRRLSLSEEIERALTDWPSLQDILAKAKAQAPRPSSMLDTELRSSEINWLTSHWAELKQYQNQWVAIEGNRIVAHGASEVEVDEQARSHGITTPFVVYIPGKGEVPFIGGTFPWL